MRATASPSHPATITTSAVPSDVASSSARSDSSAAAMVAAPTPGHPKICSTIAEVAKLLVD